MSSDEQPEDFQNSPEIQDVIDAHISYQQKPTVKHRTAYRKALLACSKHCAAERKRVMQEMTVNAKGEPKAPKSPKLPKSPPKLKREKTQAPRVMPKRRKGPEARKAAEALDAQLQAKGARAQG